MPGPAHKPFATAESVAREMDLSAENDAAFQCALFGITLEDLLQELRHRKQKKMLQVKDEMALAAKQGGERVVLRGRQDEGYIDMQIHPASYHYWGQRLGYDCWQDPQFRKEYLRDNEASRVKTITKAQIVRPNLPAPNRTALSPLRPGVHGRRGRWAA
jgi:hypothetical protein